MLIDTHAHLDASRFANDLPEVISRATDAGVSRIIAIGCDVDSSRATIAIAERFEQVYAVIGVHPCYVMDVTQTDWLEQIHAMAAHPKVVALGEMGVDEYHPPPAGTTAQHYHDRQTEFFVKQMELAAALGRNIVVHQRNCYEKAVRLVKPFAGRLRAQFHCFIDPYERAAPLLADGHLVSFTGIATYPKAPEVMECARAIPTGKFMVETDCPYLPAQAVRGKRNEPAFVRHTAQAIAKARGISLEKLAAETSAAAETFFGLIPEGE